MIIQQLADVSLELARMQYQYAVIVSYVVYTIIAVTAVLIFYALLESRPEDKKEECVAISMITSESAHRRKAQAEMEASIAAMRTMIMGYRALRDKELKETNRKIDVIYKVREEYFKFFEEISEKLKRHERNFKVLDKRTKKKDKPKDLFLFGDVSTQIEVPTGSELNKELVKKVAKQVKDFDSLEVTEDDKERALNWMISDRINNR